MNIFELDNEDSAIRNLRQFGQDAELMDGLDSSLLKEYPNEWVAFYQGQIVSHGATLQEVLDDMNERKIPAEHAVIQFLDTDRPVII